MLVSHHTGNNMEDKHLVERVLNGDTKAFGVIIRQTERLVLQIVFKMISNEEDRKDLVQEIYLKVYKKLESFKFQSKLSTWIAQIGYNACLDYLRKKKIAVEGILPEGRAEADESGTDSLGDYHTIRADAAAERKEMAGLIRKCMEQLSPLHKALITLFHQEERSYEEIGKITGLPEGTVKSYLFRARKKLKEMMLEQYKKEDIC